MFSLLRKILKYIGPQIRNHRGLFFGAIGFFVIRIILGSILKPYYFKEIIDLLSNVVSNPQLYQDEIFTVVYLVIAVSVGATVFGRISRFFYFAFNEKMVRDLRDMTFARITNNSYTFFSNSFAGSLVTKSRRLVSSFERMSETFIYNFVNLIVSLAGVLVVLMYESIQIGLIFLGFVLLNILGISLFLRRKMQYDISSAEQDSKVSGRLADVFGNILAVKFFSARNREITSFGEYTEEGARRERKSWFWTAKLEVTQSFITVLVQSVLLYVMVLLWLRGEVSTGTLVLVQLYMTTVGDLLWELSGALSGFMKSTSDMKEVIDIFETTPDILDPNNSEKLRMREGHIVFNDITFNYNKDNIVFDKFTLDIKPGERVGIVGHSGAGKSTITKLLLRFNDVSSGSITIDGQDIRAITQDDLRSVVSYVPQEPILFHRTIKENISYGSPHATLEKIIEVSKKAHAHEFIDRLPKKYDTLVGERGVKLSGGERQRIAIARAMLKDSPILVLDEATSSLDSISEAYIQDSFNELMKNKTTVVIAHRLSTIQKMDRIVVLDKGKIAQEGTHQELLKKGGLYKDLWDHQSGGFLE
jgi:ATP-binding cassette, subfamily B, bacterial